MIRTTRILVAAVALPLWATALVAQGTTQQPIEATRSVSLEEALRLFATNNLDLRIARLELMESQGVYQQTGAFPNPTASVTHEPLSGGAPDYAESYVTVSQRFELPGRRSARRESAASAVRSAQARLFADSARLAFEVKRSYVEAVLAEDLLSVTERVADVFREAARTAAEREAHGDISRYDLTRILVERTRYENLLADAEIRASTVRRGLALLILADSAIAEVSPVGLAGDVPPDPIFDAVSGDFAARRQEVAAAQAQIEAAEASARFVRSARLPDVTAIGGYKRQSDGLSGPFLGLSIPVSLFDRKSGAVASAEARIGTSETRLRLIRRQVDNDVRRAVEVYESVKRRADRLSRDVLGASADLLQIAQVAYELGEMGLLEILDAAEALRGDRNAKAQLKADLWTAYYNLERAVGGFDAASPSTTTDLEAR